MKFSLYLFVILLCLGTQYACTSNPEEKTPVETTIEEPEKNEYAEIMDWLVLQSNSYSGKQNPRQTWELGYDGYQIKETYFWDGKPTLTIEFDIKSIAKAKIEDRFKDSVALYPKNGNSKHFSIKRFEEGKTEEIKGEYFNWMVLPEQKEEALAKISKLLMLVNG